MSGEGRPRLSAAERAALIEAYARGPARLKEAVAAIPTAAMQWRPGPGEWSAHEIVVHCADAETHAASRIRMLVTEKDALIQGYDQDAWARLFDYHSHPWPLALDVVVAIRASTAALLRRLPEAAWAKAGRHTESGRYGAEDWLRIYAEHLEGHARQVEANAAAWHERAG